MLKRRELEIDWWWVWNALGKLVLNQFKLLLLVFALFCCLILFFPFSFIRGNTQTELADGGRVRYSKEEL